MDKGQELLSGLLSDPAAISAAMEMAKSLLGNANTAPAAPAQGASGEDGGKEPAAAVSAPVSPPRGGEDDKTKLLLALKPFLSPKRSEKVGTVLALMKAMQVMGAASLFDNGGKS